MTSEDHIEQWENLDIKERREIALPLIWKSLKALTEEKVPEHVTAFIVENPKKLAVYAAQELKNAGYKIPKFTGSMG